MPNAPGGHQYGNGFKVNLENQQIQNEWENSPMRMENVQHARDISVSLYHRSLINFPPPSLKPLEHHSSMITRCFKSGLQLGPHYFNKSFFSLKNEIVYSLRKYWSVNCVSENCKISKSPYQSWKRWSVFIH